MLTAISQSMYFPWGGILDQVRLVDTFVHYDDVQFARGGFVNRVQLRTGPETSWMTIPLRSQRLGDTIAHCMPDDGQDWRGLHRRKLLAAYGRCSFVDDMIAVFDAGVLRDGASLAAVSRASMLALADYFGIAAGTRFIDSTGMSAQLSGSQRVLSICMQVGTTHYVTGHGARRYLDHALFENSGIDVRYMDYRIGPYPQCHAPFTPYVTGLDLVANCGPGGVSHLHSRLVPWAEFIGRTALGDACGDPAGGDGA